MRIAIVVAGVALLAAGCTADQHGDLKQELTLLTKDLRGRVDPLPQVKPYEPVPYKAESEIDPFRPGRIDVVGPAGPTSPTGPKPDMNRAKEPLEAFPLESIAMVGTLTQGKDTFALVKAGTNLYRVKKGNYMGQNFGVITAVDEGQVSLKELVQDGAGEWVERTSALQLQEARR